MRAFLEHYRRAIEEADLYSVLQNMTQRKLESIKGYIRRLQVIMQRIKIQTSHGQRISWMRREIKANLIKMVKMNPMMDAKEYERKLL